MDRREFLKLAGLVGVAVASPFGAEEARAQDEPYEGPLFLVVHAGGGWDPTSLCDPKGRLSDTDPEPVNHYRRDDIRSPDAPSAIRWAPFGNNDAFFRRHASRLMVINGLDTATNNHDVGPRHIHSGTLNEGHPAFAALVASQRARMSPLAFLTYGGYDVTRGVVPRARAGNIGAIERVAYPNRLDNNALFHTEATEARIHAAQQARTQAALDRQHLPYIQDSISTLLSARLSQNALKRLSGLLPNLDSFTTELGKQGALAIAAWRAGLCVSANLSVGGFDTHGNHDTSHAQSLSRLTDGLNELWGYAESLDAEERVTLVVGSDFGRTPHYNEGNGKDHWSITSMLLMGAGIPGNTVIGATDDQFRALPVNPQTFQPDPGGVILRPVHVQRALRRLVGLDGTELSAQYPLAGEDLPLFG
jgi:hypothetical protein